MITAFVTETYSYIDMEHAYISQPIFRSWEIFANLSGRSYYWSSLNAVS